MQVGRLYSVLVLLGQEIEKVDTPSRLRQLSGRIEALTHSQPKPNGQSQEDTGHQEYWRGLRDDLQLCPSNLVGATRRQILKNLGATTLTGTGLTEVVEGIFQKSNVSPTDAVAALNRLAGEVEDLFKRVGRLTEDLACLGVHSDRLNPGQCEIEIHIPFKDEKLPIGDLQETVKQFAQHLQPLKRVVQEGDSDGMTLSGLGSPGCQLFLDVGLMSTVAFSAVMRQISDVHVRVQQRRELRKSTEALYPPYVLEEMDRADAEMFSSEYKRIAEQVVEEHGPTAESSDELKVLMTATVKFLAEKIEEGIIFDFRAEPEEELSPEDSQARPQEAEKIRERILAARKVNLLSGTLVAAREGRPIPPVVSGVFRNGSREMEKAATASSA